MILIPKTLYAQYLNFLKKNNVAADQYQEYVKWLRYFLDFCAKHVITPDKSERIRLFSEKLHEKNQSEDLRQQAANAISLYFEMQGLDAHSPSAADESNQQSSVASVEYLAVKCKVASSTQNQAFNSLLFFFRHGLKREFGILQGVPRAKKSLYIPTVLSRPESTLFWPSSLAHTNWSYSYCSAAACDCLSVFN